MWYHINQNIDGNQGYGYGTGFEIERKDKMKKKLIFLLTALVILTGTAACGKEADGEKIDSRSEKRVSTDKLLSVLDADLDKCVKLGDYDNMDIVLEGDYEVTEDDVMEYINMYLSYEDTYAETDKKTVEEGDIVNMDYTGSIDGEEFSGGSDSGAHLEIGSNQFIDGFEAGLVGHQTGETVTLDLRFPDDYWNEDYSGKDVKFEVVINSIDEKQGVTYETATDEYVKEKYGYDTKQAWYDATLSSLESSAEQQKMSEAQEKIVSGLMEISEVEVPDAMIEKELDETVRQVVLYAESSLDGMSLDDYLKQYENCDSEEAFRDKIREEVKGNLEQQLLIDAVIKDKGTTITEGGYADFIAYYLESYGMEEKEFYERYGSKESIMLIYAENMVLNELADKVVGN